MKWLSLNCSLLSPESGARVFRDTDGPGSRYADDVSVPAGLEKRVISVEAASEKAIQPRSITI